MPDYVLEVRNVSKTFPGVKALQNIDFAVKRGSVHALMGENGAGKSTLVKVLYGMYSPDPDGVMLLDGEAYRPKNPLDALKKGIAIVPQEISPVPNITMTANLYLGREFLKHGIFLDKKKMRAQTREVLEELGIPEMAGNAATNMSEVPVAQAQLLALATAVTYDAKLIILDEPTTALTETEVARLYRIVRAVNERGVSFIYISHKLDEIFHIADEVTVFRDGEVVGSKEVAKITKDEMIRMMVGREVKDFFSKTIEPQKEIVFEVKDFCRAGKFENISFQLRKGEILGVAGLMGAGRSEVMEAIFGYVPAQTGSIVINGRKREPFQSPIEAIEAGIGIITEDRKLTGCLLNMSVGDNIALPSLDEFLRKGFRFLNFRGMTQRVREFSQALRIKTPNLATIINNLSGGNQQKALIARWLLLNPNILIMDEPTKGIDVGAKHEIYTIMEDLVSKGKSIIMVSSDMLELLSMSDRILVLYNGRSSGALPRTYANQESILRMATGERVRDVLQKSKAAHEEAQADIQGEAT
ncbi:MAG: sugar ABC transporter ATP-binding protein [Spirochaetota bacterium]